MIFGLRARLGFPRGRAVVVLSLLVALCGAAVGGALGSRLGWEFAEPYPSGAAAAEVTATAFPGLRVWGGGDGEVLVMEGSGEGYEYGFARYWIRHRSDATRDIPGYAAAARDRFTAAGWQVSDYLYEPPEALVDRGEASGASFVASRGDLTIGFENWLYTGMPSYDADGGAALTVRRAEPSWIGWFAWPGAVLGGVLTWFVFAWASRRLSAVVLSGAFPGILTGVMIFLFVPSVLFQVVPDTVGGASPWWAGLIGGGELSTGPLWFAELIAGGLLLWALLTGRHPLRVLVRRPRITLAALAAVLVAALAVWVLPLPPSGTPLTVPACRPAPGPPPAAPASETRDSKKARVYVDPASTPDQRNLIEAAIWRSYAATAGYGLTWDPGSAEFRDAYCDGGTVPADAVAGLPYFFPVELGVASDYPALLEEIQGMPGIVAVQQVPA